MAKKPHKKIIIPVNITHNGDMDGEGCAFLTKYIFDDYKIRVSGGINDPTPTTYTRTPDGEIDDSLGYFCSDRKRNRKLEKKIEELKEKYADRPEIYEKKLNQYINRTSIPKDLDDDEYIDGLVAEHDQIAFSSPIIIGIPNTFNGDLLADDIVNRVLDKIKKLKDDVEDYSSRRDEIEILYIVTDIYVSKDILDNSFERISNEVSVVGMKYWSFDHHISNPDYHKSKISSTADIIVRNRSFNYCPDSAYIADNVVICEGYHIEHIYDSIHKLTKTHGFEAMQPVIEYCSKLDMFENCLFWKRSATFHYFMFLLKAGFFSLDAATDDLINIDTVVWIVYIITMYDTFEFDIKDLPKKISLPDALTIMFKYVGKFGVMSNLLLDYVNYVYEEIRTRSSVKYDMDGNCIENKYTDIPLPNDMVDRLAELVETRENKFMRELYSAKTITINQLRCALMDDDGTIIYTHLDEILSQYDKNTKIVLFAGAVDDSSYAGNTCCKRYGFDLAIMMYNEKRTISLRSNNKEEYPFDCVTVAKALGGGGHICAAGCSLDMTVYMNLLKLFWSSAKPIKEYLEGLDYDVQ